MCIQAADAAEERGVLILRGESLNRRWKAASWKDAMPWKRYDLTVALLYGEAFCCRPGHEGLPSNVNGVVDTPATQKPWCRWELWVDSLPWVAVELPLLGTIDRVGRGGSGKHLGPMFRVPSRLSDHERAARPSAACGGRFGTRGLNFRQQCGGARESDVRQRHPPSRRRLVLYAHHSAGSDVLGPLIAIPWQ